MQVVARKFTHVEFQSYLDRTELPRWAKFVVVHNTSSPDIALYNQWQARKGKWVNWSEEQWLRNLTSYYSNMGWRGAPHLFIPPTPDTVLVLNSLSVPGTHTPSWNGFSLGVETVGEFEREAFQDPTHANLVFALAALHKKFGLRPDQFDMGKKGLHFHKEDKATTHRTCPGKHIVKSALVADVLSAMGLEGAVPVPDPHTHEVPMASQTADTSGMSMEELTSVKWLQTKLNGWGRTQRDWEPLTVDGVRGPKTTTATKRFQTALHLVVDGIAGPVTRATLKKVVK